MRIQKLRKIICSMPGIVSCWIPGGDGVAIDIVRGNHGIVHGANRNVEVQPRQIRSDLGWEFDPANSEYIKVPHHSSLNAQGEISIGGWFFVSSSDDDKRLLEKELEYYALRYSNNKLYFYYHIGGSYSGLNYLVNANKWNFFVATYNNKTHVQSLYLQNSLVAQTELTGLGSYSINKTTNVFTIGKAGSSYFSGYQSLIFKADKEWSLADVKNLYNALKDLFYPRG